MASFKVKLGVNIDHIATLRQARKIGVPDLLEAARICKKAGADGITIHLRQDRRHIQDEDVFALKKYSGLPLNVEMSAAEDIVNVVLDARPDEVCIVPENPLELTTEGGLNVVSNLVKITGVAEKLKKKGIVVSIFINPDVKQIIAARKCGADCVELHTGLYADSKTVKEKKYQLIKIINAAAAVIDSGLVLNAGHGLDYENVGPISKIKGLNALNIGFSIVAKSVFVGLYNAVKEMKDKIRKGE
ncbi:MAG: pyridoxine 5'-phosphate synthase [Elusimicrobiota bacterium]